MLRIPEFTLRKARFMLYYAKVNLCCLCKRWGFVSATGYLKEKLWEVQLWYPGGACFPC